MSLSGRNPAANAFAARVPRSSFSFSTCPHRTFAASATSSSSSDALLEELQKESAHERANYTEASAATQSPPAP